MTDTGLIGLILVLLIALELVIVATRSAYVHTGLARRVQRDTATPQIRRSLALVQVLPRLQASLELIQTLDRFLMAGVLLFSLLRQSWRPSVWWSVSVMALAALVVFWTEWLLDGWVQRNADEWAVRLSAFARLALWMGAPFIVLPMRLAGASDDGHNVTGTVTEDELKNLVDVGEQEGLLEQGERNMIYSIFELGDTLAREVMVPRIDVLALEVNTSLEAAVEALLHSGHSRVPVYEDNVDNILGLLYAKDLLRVWKEGNEIGSLRDLLRPAYFVPEAKKVDELLAEMQSRRIHMAIVVDEYGGVAGLVTLEDIAEEILGEIQDEYDQAEELPYKVLPSGEYLFQGRIGLDDFNEVLASHLPTNEADTLGGFIYSRIGRVPASGEAIRVDDLVLTVEQVIGRRIRTVRAGRIPPNLSREEVVSHVDR